MRISKKVAYWQHTIYRRLPNFITNIFPPLLMSLPYVRRAEKNKAKIPVNLTSQAICAKHCGGCPSNPFTQGGLYCISGQSKAKVVERGCHCFECELFEKCGGLGYFCKFGSADQMHANPNLGNDLNTKLNQIVHKPQVVKTKDQIVQAERSLSHASSSSGSSLSENAYDENFVQALIERKEEELSKSVFSGEEKVKKVGPLKSLTVTYEDSNRKINVPYGKSLLEISLDNDIVHTHVCGGQAKCSTCRVLIISGASNVSKRNTAEELIAIRKQFPPRVRLACQTVPQGDVTIRRIVRDKKSTDNSIHQKSSEANFFAIDAHVAVLFADIRAFTTFSETNLVYDVVQMLNEYFATITQPIDNFGGYIDKYMGDGIMAIFGLANRPYPPEEAALRAALEMLRKVKDFNIALKRNYDHEFKIGIGIDAGEVVMAKLGFKKKTQFTAIGDVVNTSARIESETKNLSVNTLVSHNVYKVLHNKFEWGKRSSTQLKGKISITNVYEPLAEKIIAEK